MIDETSSTIDGTRRVDAQGRALVVFSDGGVVEHGLPDEGTIVIGRGRDVDVTLDDPTLSRVHARLSLGAHVTIEDCGSRNGTRVGGHPLTPGEAVLVAPGTTIEVGDVVMVVRGAHRTGDLLASSDASPEGASALDRAIAQLARAPVAVLLAGEPGVGKAHVAARIHAASRRIGGFIALACSRARTAADVEHHAQAAMGGTLLVREPGELTHDAQIALDAALAVRGREVRVVTTSRTGDLPGPLRLRLGGVTVVVPPLRARLRELPRLTEEIVSELVAEQGRPPPLVGAMAIARLGRHPWPGNVRELQSVLARALVRARGRVIQEADIDLGVDAPAPSTATLSSAVAEAEHQRILEALRQCDGNQTRAAKLLGISRGTLISRLERYAVPRPRK